MKKRGNRSEFHSERNYLLQNWYFKTTIIYSSSKICDVYKEYVEKTNQFKPIRQALLDLGTHTRVLEPTSSLWDPKIIVAFAPGVCIEISLDPSNPEAVPKILIQGPDRKIQPLLSALASNIHKYDSEYSLAVNLERILEVELPSSCSLDQTSLDNDRDSVECGICYVYKLGDSVPTEVCDNEKCGQPFHAECLYEHLSTSHGATKSHNTIFGKCPFCETDIICQFQLSK